MKKITSLVAFGVTTLSGALFSAESGEHSEWDLKGLDAAKLPAAASASGLTYEKDIKPILEASCFGCHGEDRQRGDLRLDSREALLKGGEHGKMVQPGKSIESLLVFSAAQSNDDIAMPPKRRPGGGPGGRGRGGFQPPPEVLKEFDKNNDGELNDEERQAMFESFRARRGQRGPGGPDAQAGPRGPRGEGGPNGQAGRRGPGGAGGQRGQGRGPGGRGFGGGPPAQPLTAEQVGIIRAWIDQGAK